VSSRSRNFINRSGRFVRRSGGKRNTATILAPTRVSLTLDVLSTTIRRVALGSAPSRKSPGLTLTAAPHSRGACAKTPSADSCGGLGAHVQLRGAAQRRISCPRSQVVKSGISSMSGRGGGRLDLTADLEVAIRVAVPIKPRDLPEAGLRPAGEPYAIPKLEFRVSRRTRRLLLSHRQ
jgi:hypothetical protein